MKRINHCTVCLSRNIQLEYTISSIQAATHFSLTGMAKFSEKTRQSLDKKIKKLWGGSVCTWNICKNCGAKFALPNVSGDREFYNTAFDGNYPNDGWEFNKTISEISLMPKFKELKYLEIGAGSGSFAKKLINLGVSKKKILCTEYSEIGIKSIKEIGVPCTTLNIERIARIPKNNCSFDIICFFQILEHIDNIYSFLRSIDIILRKNSHVFLSVPNPYWSELNSKYHGLIDMPPNHLCEYSKKSFEIIAKNLSWKIAEITIQQSSPSVVKAGILHYQRLQEKIDTMLNVQNKKTMFDRLRLNLDLFLSKNIGMSEWVHLVK